MPGGSLLCKIVLEHVFSAAARGAVVMMVDL
jgi:hypothetical protein